jgi:hypothetical protein
LPRRAAIKPELVFDDLEGDERERIRRLIEFLSRLMDAQFELPGVGWRFGLDPLIGLIPAIGDLVSTVVSLYIIGLAGRYGLPRITLARMSLNVLVDMLLGAVPLAGDLFDVWWKANQRNARLLAERLADQSLESRRAKTADWLFVTAMIVGLALVFVGLIALAVFVFAAVWEAIGRLFSA